LHNSKSLTLHSKEQIIDSSRERGRCVMVRGRGLIHQDRITKDNTDSPIADNLNTKANELYASAEKDSKAITSGITDSVKRGEHFMSIAMGAAQKAVAQDQLIQSIAQAYLTGGMAGIQQMVKTRSEMRLLIR
jgi:hypothetical protein